MQRITPCLWFNDNAEKAVKFYTSIFRNSKITTVPHYGEAGSRASDRPVGTVMTTAFKLANQDFLALNGGPHFTLSNGHLTRREPQDATRDRRSVEQARRGRQDRPQCGWLLDKFGVSWQIVPADIGKLVQDSRDGKADRLMPAILGMKKIDVATLKRAAR